MTYVINEFRRTHLACMADLLTCMDSGQFLAKGKLLHCGRLHFPVFFMTGWVEFTLGGHMFQLAQTTPTRYNSLDNLGGSKSEIRVPAWLSSGESFFLAQWMATFSVPSRGKGQGSPYKGTNLIMGLPSYLPRV